MTDTEIVDAIYKKRGRKCPWKDDDGNDDRSRYGWENGVRLTMHDQRKFIRQERAKQRDLPEVG